MTDKISGELAPERPETPDEWVSELEIHSKRARKIVARYSRSKGAFHHVKTFRLELVEGEFFKVWEDSGSGTDIHYGDRVSSRRIIEHIWAELCEFGIEYAHKQGLERIRGAIEITDENNEPLNDPDLSRKVLHLGAGTTPWTGEQDDMSKGEASAYGQLKWYTTENRRLASALAAHQVRDETRAEERFAFEQQIRVQGMSLGQDMITFSNYKADVIRKDLEEEAGNARSDMVVEAMIEAFAPKAPEVMDALSVYLRTAGGTKPDERKVPDLPSRLSLWVLATFGPEQYGVFSHDVLMAQDVLPTGAGYLVRWTSVLGTLNDSLESAQLTAVTADALASWGNDACAALKLDPHSYSRVCFARENIPSDTEQAVAPETK